MKILYLPLIFAVLFLTSCSSSYKTAQSSNDPYYSSGSQNQGSGSDQYYNANSDDQYLMMKSQDPTRWSYFDNYAYDGYYAPDYGLYNTYGSGMYNPYGYGYSPLGYFPMGYSPFGYYTGIGFSPFMGIGYSIYGPSFLSNYYMWNGFYNPYYGGAIVVTKYSAGNYYTQLHPFTLTSYTGTAINNGNSFRNSFSNGNRATLSNSGNSNSSRFSNNSNNSTNNFFRTQSTQSQSSFRSFSPSSSFGGGGRASFGRR